MFGLFTRLARRPRTLRRPLRTALRLEFLEARANPAAPVLTGMKADWGNEQFVVISGVIQDESPGSALIHVGGSAQGDVHVGNGGAFSIALKTTGTGAIYLRAEDNEQLKSGVQSVSYGDATPVSAGNHPVLSGVSIIRDENGLWHIRGHVDSTSPIGTVIKIVSGPGDTGGQSGIVDVDGNFDIVLDIRDGSGSISIIAANGETGDQSDPWDGLVG
jgi:hypothetical protein